MHITSVSYSNSLVWVTGLVYVCYNITCVMLYSFIYLMYITCASSSDSLVWVIGVARCLFSNGILEDLSPVYLLFHTATCDQSVDHHILLLANSKCPVNCLCICGWVPAGIDYNEHIKEHCNRCLTGPEIASNILTDSKLKLK